MTNKTIQKLSSSGCSVSENEPLSKHTSFRIGGEAEFFVEIPNEEALCVFLKEAAEQNMRFYVLGGGTNVLFPDSGFRGTIVKLTGEFECLSIKGSFAACGAGVNLPALVKKTAGEGLSGLECCAGIPGTAGGAVLGNAGSAQNWIGDAVESVEVYKKNPAGAFEKRLLKRDEIAFGYRESGLEGCVIFKVNFTLKKEDGNDILKTVAESIEKRVKSQPLSLPNAGCIFKNPAGLSAGKLIDDAGLKGRKKGGAKVSEIHANFIVNAGNASYADILDLIYIVRKTVKEKFNIDLELELKIFDN